MNAASNYPTAYAVADAPAHERAEFVRRTYFHLAGAIFGFFLLEVVFFKSGVADKMMGAMLGGRYSWLFVLGAFMAVSWIADKWAQSDTSIGTQYAGLALYTLAEAVIFVPLLGIATLYSSPTVIPTAAILTALIFLGLTAAAFITRKDFSFLGPILCVGGFVALGLIVVAIVFGFNLGLLFAGAMAILASVAILYTTSNILHRYRPDQHVAASLALFAAVALLFWYVLRIVMSLSSSRN